MRIPSSYQSRNYKSYIHMPLIISTNYQHLLLHLLKCSKSNPIKFFPSILNSIYRKSSDNSPSLTLFHPPPIALPLNLLHPFLSLISIMIYGYSVLLSLSQATVYFSPTGAHRLDRHRKFNVSDLGGGGAIPRCLRADTPQFPPTPESVHSYSSRPQAPGSVSLTTRPLPILQRYLNVCTASMSPCSRPPLRLPRGLRCLRLEPAVHLPAKHDFYLDQTVRLLIFGDMIWPPERGDDRRLEEKINTHRYDAIFHNGLRLRPGRQQRHQGGPVHEQHRACGRSPALHDLAGQPRDPTTSNYHYMYNSRCPGGTNGLWYSFNAGRVHFISYSTEQIFDDVPADQAL